MKMDKKKWKLTDCENLNPHGTRRKGQPKTTWKRTVVEIFSFQKRSKCC